MESVLIKAMVYSALAGLAIYVGLMILLNAILGE